MVQGETEDVKEPEMPPVSLHYLLLISDPKQCDLVDKVVMGIP